MKLILLFLLAVFLAAIWSANRSRPSRAVVLLGGSFLIAVAFLSQRAL